MPAVMTIPELERFLAAEFPQAFYPESGLSIEAVWDGGCLVRQAFREVSLRPGGTISGPTMMALADVALYVAVLAALRKPGRCDLTAEARLLKLGKRLATGEVTLRCEGEKEAVAHVTATYSIPPDQREPSMVT